MSSEAGDCIDEQQSSAVMDDIRKTLERLVRSCARFGMNNPYQACFGMLFQRLARELHADSTGFGEYRNIVWMRIADDQVPARFSGDTQGEEVRSRLNIRDVG